MKKRMEPLTVETNEDGQIVITQECPVHDDSIIVLDRDQVDTVVEWLLEAKAINKNSTDPLEV